MRCGEIRFAHFATSSGLAQRWQSDEADIPLKVQGVYIVGAGNRTVKVSFNQKLGISLRQFLIRNS